MVTRRTDYTADAVEAARSVMLELSRVLGEYQNDMVIVGGWVPELLIEKAPRAHVGPTHVADFDDISDPEDRAIVQRDAFERVDDLLIRLHAR